MTAGNDWVDLDIRSMERTRRAERAEEARRDEAMRRRAEERQQRSAVADQEILAALEDDAGEGRPSAPPRSGEPAAAAVPAEPAPQRRPVPQVQSLHIENLKSLAGAHDIPLAPLTLVYGPNASGKSTVLHGLQLFLNAVKSGRHDALHMWDRAFETFQGSGVDQATAWDLVTRRAAADEPPADEPEPERLSLGVTFAGPGGRPARADLGYQPPYMDTLWHTSALGYAGGDRAVKDFWIHWEGWPTDTLTYSVSTLAGEKPKRVRADNQLFGGAHPELQDELFGIAAYLRYLGPHRGTPGEHYVAQRGPFRAHETWETPYGLRERLNQALTQLDVPYRFSDDRWGEGRRPARILPLQDKRSGVEVSLDQVGFGVSQLLPVVNTCVEASEQIICVEEPELHLHPRLQAGLGNLFAHAVLARGNQVIVETHSESILLRVRRLIRQGKFQPDEVAVIYVDNTADTGASVRRIRLGEQGELLDPWPAGFFDDSLDDVLGGWG